MTIKDKLIALKSRPQERTTRIPSPESDMNRNATVQVDETVIYRVYKRRWLGVVIIMLLNIVSSWRYARSWADLTGFIIVGLHLLRLQELPEIILGYRLRHQLIGFRPSCYLCIVLYPL
jgi:hypothetical protein